MELLQHPPDTSQNNQDYPKKETTHCLLHSLFKAKTSSKILSAQDLEITRLDNDHFLMRTVWVANNSR
jgi:hypothetical protein